MSDGGPPGLSADQQHLVKTHLWLVDAIAREIAPGLGKRVRPEDLHALGNLGLVEAALAFDPPVLHDENAFRHFAKHRIRGAMLDEDRDEAREQTRVVKLAMKAGYRYLERQRRRGDFSTDQDGKTEERLLDHIGGLAGSMFSASRGAAPPKDPEAALSHREQQTKAQEAFARAFAKLERLKPNQARVLREHYLNEEKRTLADIGRDMKLQHPAVYRVHDEAMRRIHGLLLAEGLTEAPPPEEET